MPAVQKPVDRKSLVHTIQRVPARRKALGAMRKRSGGLLQRVPDYGGRMELQMEGRHFKVTPAIQTHLTEKLAKLEKYFDGIHRIHVILDVEKNKTQTVELVCTAAKRHTLVAKGSSDDLYAAIDVAEKKLLRELKKLKERLRPIIRGKRPVAELSPAMADGEEAEE